MRSSREPAGLGDVAEVLARFGGGQGLGLFDLAELGDLLRFLAVAGEAVGLVLPPGRCDTTEKVLSKWVTTRVLSVCRAGRTRSNISLAP